MEKILIFVFIGLGAQLVDGTLGMAFGVTATTLFMLSGTGAATASAVVHVVQVGTTFVSGVSHWRFGNVDWKRVIRLGVPGGVGAFLGATFLSNLDTDAARPVTSSILLCLGLWVLIRFAFLHGRKRKSPDLGSGKLGALGFTGGMLDATGGGGWGPVTTSTLLSVEADQPRKVIGTVSASEFIVTCAAVVGFLPMLRQEFMEHTAPIIGLLIGGIVAAPLAAYLVGKINPRFLGIVVGGVLVSLNILTLLSDHVPTWALATILGTWAVIVISILIWAMNYSTPKSLRERVELAAAETADVAEDSDSDRAVRAGAETVDDATKQ